MFEQITVKQLELKKQRNVKRGHFFREERFLLRREISFEKRDSFWEERFLLRREIYFERRDFFWEDFFQEHISFIFFFQEGISFMKNSFKKRFISRRVLSRRYFFAKRDFFWVESKWWQRGDNSWWATSLEKEQP